MTDTHPTGTGPDAAGLAHDYLDLYSLFSAEELALRDRARAFVSERIHPNIAAGYEAGHFPREIVKEMGTLGLLGMHLTGYGCPGRSHFALDEQPDVIADLTREFVQRRQARADI